MWLGIPTADAGRRLKLFGETLERETRAQLVATVPDALTYAAECLAEDGEPLRFDVGDLVWAPWGGGTTAARVVRTHRNTGWAFGCRHHEYTVEILGSTQESVVAERLLVERTKAIDSTA